MDSISPVNVLTSMFVLQIVLAFTMLLGVATDRSRYSAAQSPGIYILLFVSCIVSLLFIAFTADFYEIWRPMLRDLNVPTMERTTGMKWVYGINYVTSGLLIVMTGARNSPLMPILFLLPITSIFLRDHPVLTLGYGMVSGIYYLWLSFSTARGIPRILRPPTPLIQDGGYSKRNDSSDSFTAHRIVTLLCLAVTLLIGYITRPDPVM